MCSRGCSLNSQHVPVLYHGHAGHARFGCLGFLERCGSVWDPHSSREPRSDALPSAVDDGYEEQEPVYKGFVRGMGGIDRYIYIYVYVYTYTYIYIYRGI